MDRPKNPGLSDQVHLYVHLSPTALRKGRMLLQDCHRVLHSKSLYNLDKFREFVLTSTFLDRLEVETERIEKIKHDDYELLIFAFDWLKFGLFGKKVFWVKEKSKAKQKT